MAYSDYGAFVYKDGKRRMDKEDVAVFASDEETFGKDSSNIPSGARIFAFLLHQKETGKDYSWYEHIQHGVMGDGDIRVACYKQGLPDIYEIGNDGIHKIKYTDDGTDIYEYGIIDFAYKGYRFLFMDSKPYKAVMIEPDGSKWECTYDYWHGAGFE